MKNWLNISCFGAVRPFKNHLNQALAAINYAESRGQRLRFHINATRNENNGEATLKNLRGLFRYTPNHELVEHEWMAHIDLMKILREEINIGMQVSFTETYNIVAADHVAANVPMVTSNEVKFVFPLFYADPVSVPSMVSALQRANTFGKFGCKLNMLSLKINNNLSYVTWQRELDKLFK